MDSFTMQKDLHPLFAPFCNLQSAHTISRRLWREVRISTSVARSQATARTKREISDSSRASTPEKICLHQFFNLLLLLAGDLPLKRSLKGIYDLQSKDLPMLRRDFHVCVPLDPSNALVYNFPGCIYQSTRHNATTTQRSARARSLVPTCRTPPPLPRLFTLSAAF